MKGIILVSGSGTKLYSLIMVKEEYGLSKAVRPANSRLDKSWLVENDFKLRPTWMSAVGRYLKEAQL